MITILIIDDHLILREGIKLILKAEFSNIQIEEAENEIQGIKLIRAKKWDLIILDITLPGKNGLEILRQMQYEGIKLPVLVLTMHREELYAIRVIKAGASGYLTKECSMHELIEAIKKILSGRKYITQKVAELLAENIESDLVKPMFGNISDREFQVLCLIASGKTITEIASNLSLGIPTISTYRARILEKLKLKTNAELTHYAIQEGLA